MKENDIVFFGDMLKLCPVSPALLQPQQFEHTRLDKKSTDFWKCNFPIIHNVCVVCLSKINVPNYLYVRILGKCSLLLILHKTLSPPLKQTQQL